MRHLIPMLVFFATIPLVASAFDYDKELLAKRIKEERIESVTFLPCPGDKAIVAAHWAREIGWWSYVEVFHHSDSKIDGEIKLPPEYLESFGNYVVSYRWLRNEPSNQWMLEILESTHMGNGGFWLMVLEGKQLRVVLSTSVMGRCWFPPAGIKIPFEGTVRFPEKYLKVDYARDSVVVSGKLKVLDQEDKEVATVPYKEVWKWNKAKRVFQESD